MTTNERVNEGVARKLGLQPQESRCQVFTTDVAAALWALKKLCKDNSWNYEIRGYWHGSVVCQLFRHVSDCRDHEMFSEGSNRDGEECKAICEAILNS